MKQIFKFTLLAAFILSGTSLLAQSVKLGHIDSNKLLSIMPERAKAQEQLQAQAMEYDKQIQSMNEEYQKLVQTYVEQEASMSEAIKADKQKAIHDLRTRIQEFDGFAQTELNNKQTELLKPIFDKASKAIQEVGKENGFTYILDVSTGVVLFNSDSSIDIMSLVKTKLGL